MCNHMVLKKCFSSQKTWTKLGSVFCFYHLRSVGVVCSRLRLRSAVEVFKLPVDVAAAVDAAWL